MRILFIDDEAEIVMSLLNHFEADDISTLGATTLEDAVHQLNTEKFNLIVTDFNLDAGNNALNLINFISRNPTLTGKPPIIVYSGRNESYLEERIPRNEHPGVSFICKPDLEGLTLKINHVIKDAGIIRGAS